jgi:localization factor PodJL
MNSKRSYLETLNAGRRRRPLSSIEDLNRTLETLEGRPDSSRQAQPPTEPRDEDAARRMQRAAGESSWPTADPVAAASEMRTAQRSQAKSSYGTLARDIEQARTQEEGMAAVGRIAGELKEMREELRHQMTDALHQAFDALRRDIERAYAGAAGGTLGAELGLELERLSGAIHSLAQRSDVDSIEKLRLEIEQMKGALTLLAREETVRSVGQRWDELDQRWNALEERRSAPDPALEALNTRLEQINKAVVGLPETLPLTSLENKIRTLAGVIEQFSRQQQMAGPDAFELIGERLDEISRAIIASSVAAPAASIDPQPFQRIEARITSLARQIEELADERPVRQVMDGLNLLAGRVDDISRRAELPEEAVKALARQVEAITEKLDAGHAADAERMLQGFESRFAGLSAMLERRQNDASEQGRILLRELERRLEEMAERFGPAGPALLDAIEARFAALSDRLAAPADSETIRSLEARLDDISARLEHSAGQAAGVDPELIRNLEAQVSGLSEHLARPGAPLPHFEDLGPRLAHMEKSIAQSRESIMSAARQAAEEAIRGFAGSRPDEDSAALVSDLKSLETLTRRSDERNAKTFEAIHDTLLKIVERLGALETRRGERRAWPDAAYDELEEQGKLSLEAAPPMEPDGYDASFDEDRALDRSPSQAAAAAAMAALRGDADEPAQKRRRKSSMLGGIARALSSRSQGQEPEAFAGDGMSEGKLALAPELELDEPLDPKIANRPLEPGSGAPDLSAIMKRVRDERAPAARSGEPDAAKSDFIAAARRAAQAAAAEAEILKKQADMKGSEPGKFGLGGLLRSRRKTLLMAAAATILAIAGLQLGKALLADAGQLAAVETAAVEDVEAESAAVKEIAVSAPAKEEVLETAPSSAEVRSVEIAAAPVAAPSAAAATPAVEDIDEAGAAAAPEATTVMPMQPEAAPAMEPDPAAPEAALPAIQDIPAEAGPLALREAAAAGDAKALFTIGARYAEGQGVTQDLAEAAKWYESAAAKGFAPAQYRIGNLYEKGLGVARHIAKAKTWYQLAAEQGNASAMHNLAVLFAMGADGTPDNDSAARWFLEAAELGVTDSQFNLGILAAKGVGMEQNLEESYKWFALVAKTGDQDAAAKRDEVAKALAPEKLEKARAAAELWRAKPLDPEANGTEVPESWKDGEETTAAVDMKEVVRNVQLILNESGYDAGSADGIMGEKTRSAIAAFQKAKGFESTGEVTTELVQALLELD